jgi:nucleoside-diphosphate-sugar epimerase
MILVLGATGTTGGEVARQLIAADVRPRLLVRNRAKAAEFEGNAEIVEGELENWCRESLSRSVQLERLRSREEGDRCG